MTVLELLTKLSIAAALCAFFAHAAPTDSEKEADHGFVPDPSRFYNLKTQFLGPDFCLEGNKVAPGSTLGGAAFMDRCASVTGQQWKFVPTGDAYYKMQTRFLGNEMCFEGNRIAQASTLGGAAFMDECLRVTGQLWKVQPRGSKYFTLTTKFREDAGECLEGNKLKQGNTLNGAAFMAPCGPQSGQIFEAVSV